ncbi:MAG: RNA polymerase sigma factor [Solirubrobacteraceae bacterium]
MPTTERLRQIAALYVAHDAQLHSVVSRRGSRCAQIVDDACQHAWSKLLVADDVDLRAPSWRVLGWLTTTAIREAWRLGSVREEPMLAEDELQRLTAQHKPLEDDVDVVCERRRRLALVWQVPERPRRFLLRLAMGYSYREIALAEGVSLTTTNKQIARAKRILRQLDRDLTAPG